MSDLVLELGLEEVPARFLPPTLAQLEERGAALMREARLSWERLSVAGTPRRLVLLAAGLPERQAPLEVKTRGPARRVAYDAEGKPTRAALGFASGQGVAMDDLVVEETPAGEYVFAVRTDEGLPTLEILARLVPSLFGALEFPRFMRWGRGEYRFVRPVRWLLALLDREVIPCSFAGVESGRVTWGHRTIHPGPRQVERATDYPRVMEELGVMVDPLLRRNEIQRQVSEVASALGGEVLSDEELLEEVTFLCEHPTAVGGRFEESFLTLPPQVPATVLRHHQRFFTVRSRMGGKHDLLPAFVAVRDGGRDYLDTVRTGYERVVRARLADARFFFSEDLKVPLARWRDSLAQVGFLEGLGTLAQKTERMVMMARFLGYAFGVDQSLLRVCERAAWLSKADRATHMVRELPELEGIMGREYALRSGEDQAVAEAIREHYLPRFAQDELPQSMAGMVVSIADRLDTLTGAFMLGLEPTGSQDPYGLRRAAYGLVRMLWAAGLRLSLGWAVEEAQNAYAQVLGQREEAGGEPAEGEPFGRDRAQSSKRSLLEFLRARARNLFAEQGIRADLIEAVIAESDDVAEAWLKAQALEEAKEYPEFQDALAAFRRVVTLAQRADHDQVDSGLLKEPAEIELWNAYSAVERTAREQATRSEWRRFLATVATLRPAVDRFLDRVLVMAEDPALRANRLALLLRLARLFGLLGDLSRVVVV